MDDNIREELLSKPSEAIHPYLKGHLLSLSFLSLIDPESLFSMKSACSIFALLVLSSCLCVFCETEAPRFLLVNGGSIFFEPVLEGFNDTCHNLEVTCEFVVPTNCSARESAVRDFVASRGDGIIYKRCGDLELDLQLIQEATDAGVPVVEIDGKTPNAPRIAYVGTNNEFMGRTIARLLRQLRPEGGTFAIVSPKSERLEGFVSEITKDNFRPDRAHWFEVERNFSLEGIYQDYMLQMDLYAKLNPTAMIFLRQAPMRNANWTRWVSANRSKNITLIGVDGADFQLSYLNRRFVDGLVGQLPYEFGSLAVQVLYEYWTTGKLEKDEYDTNVVSYNLIPTELPEVQLDKNLIGNLQFVGLCFFGTIALAAIACMAWTWYHRQSVVIKAAQPFFLMMVAGGVLITAGTLIPLSFDDGGNEISEQQSVGICMSIPWLASTGFTVTFSGLFSKMWRVNRLFQQSNRRAKIKVAERDVLLPFIVLFILNMVVLVCWTVIDPLTYVRLEDDGTDYWNRAIATYGSCQSQHTAAYLIPLAFINFSVLLFAGWHAYQARDIQVEFSESKYIGLAMLSFGQGFLTGIPIVTVTRETPKAFYVVMALLIFLLCMVTLFLIFLPKYLLQREYARLSEPEQKKMMEDIVRQNASANSSSLLAGSRHAERTGSLADFHESRSSMSLNQNWNETKKSSLITSVRSSPSRLRENGDLENLDHHEDDPEALDAILESGADVSSSSRSVRSFHDSSRSSRVLSQRVDSEPSEEQESGSESLQTVGFGDNEHRTDK